jgi:hypothetical protein
MLTKIRQLPLSFRTAKELRGLAEMLPPGPQWKCQPWETVYPTKIPVKLYYRDAIECLESLFGNPLFADALQFAPFRLFKTAQKLVRVYNEWMSGNVAWEMQVSSHSLCYGFSDVSVWIRANYLLAQLSLARFCHPIRRPSLL